MSGTFNIVHDHWIPVELDEGGTELFSLQKTLTESKRIRRIDGEVPTQVFAILGLLSAVLRRAAEGPKDLADWKLMYTDPMSVFSDVIDYLNKFEDRFELRASTQPFYQVADLHTAKNEHSPLQNILADVPNGEPFFTTRAGEGNARISWAEGARWLVHVQSFDPSGIRSGAVGDPRVKGGKGYPIGPGWGAQIGGLVIEGKNLWETLMLNLVPTKEGDLKFDPDADLPPWERPQLTEKEEMEGGREPRGPVDLATWQSRRIRLVGDDQGVTGVVLCQGDLLKPQNRVAVEPRTAWRYSDPQSKRFKTEVYMPREHDPGRALWRGLEGILPHTAPRAEKAKNSNAPLYRSPALSEWLEKLIDEQIITAGSVRYRAIGMQLGSNQSVIAEIIDDSIELPSFLFAPEADYARNRVVYAARLAEDLSRVFGYYAANLARAAGADMTDGEEARAREQILAAIGPQFTKWVVRVIRDNVDEMMREWGHLLFEISQREANVLIAAVPPAAYEGRMTSRGEMSVGKADIFFRAARRKLGIEKRKLEGKEGGLSE